MHLPNNPVVLFALFVVLLIGRAWVRSLGPAYYTWNDGRPGQTRTDRAVDGCLNLTIDLGILVIAVFAVVAALEAWF